MMRAPSTKAARGMIQFVRFMENSGQRKTPVEIPPGFRISV
jgi:hypothetical protein